MAPRTPCPDKTCKSVCLRNLATGEVVKAEKVLSISAGESALLRYDNPNDYAAPYNPVEWEEVSCDEPEYPREEVCLLQRDGSIYLAHAVLEVGTDNTVTKRFEAIGPDGEWNIVTGEVVICPCDINDPRIEYPLDLGTPAPASDLFNSTQEAYASLAPPNTIALCAPMSAVTTWTRSIFQTDMFWPPGNWYAVTATGFETGGALYVVVTDETGFVVHTEIGAQRSSWQLNNPGVYTVRVSRTAPGRCDGDNILNTQITVK